MVKTRRLLWTYLFFAMLVVKITFAQSTLTQVKDTVVNSDGTLFSGTVVITWNGFTGTGSGTVSPLSTSARIYNGALSVLLVPTTTASVGTFYQAVYNSSSGTMTWTETWQVPVSSTPVTLSTIRISSSQGSSGTISSGGSTGSSGTSSGTTSGTGQYATLPITINQVTSLGADLASINSTIAALTAQLNSVSSGLNAGSTAVFKDADSMVGALNGTNNTFTLSQIPTPANSLNVYRNGLIQTPNIDYTLSGANVMFLSGSIPKAGDLLEAYYRIAGTAALASFTDYETPSGTIDGTNTGFTLAIAPSPALSLKLYKNGVLLTQNADYTLSGNGIMFSTVSVTPQTGDSLVASYRH